MQAEDQLRDYVYKPIADMKSKEQRKKAIIAKVALATAADMDLTKMFVKAVDDSKVPRILDANGEPKTNNGKPVYDKSSPYYKQYKDHVDLAIAYANTGKNIIKIAERSLDGYNQYHNINVGGGGNKNKNKKHTGIDSASITII